MGSRRPRPWPPPVREIMRAHGLRRACWVRAKVPSSGSIFRTAPLAPARRPHKVKRSLLWPEGRLPPPQRCSWRCWRTSCAPNTVTDPPSDHPIATRMVVEKQPHRMTVYRGERMPRQFRVALGHGGLGPKMQQGDGRVPEGQFVILGRIPKSAYHFSLKISYPTAEQIRAAAARGLDLGGDIMIHGLPNGEALWDDPTWPRIGRTLVSRSPIRRSSGSGKQCRTARPSRFCRDQEGRTIRGFFKSFSERRCTVRV
jgi:hypothetical protein